MAPDLDVLIQSPTDPLLQLEYTVSSRTHWSLFLLAPSVCYPFLALVRRHMSFKVIWLTALAGYATHGLLDACTTYERYCSGRFLMRALPGIPFQS